MDQYTAVKDLEVGNVVQGNGNVNTEWEITQCVLPFREGTTYRVEFQNVETGERQTRYLPELQRYIVIR